MRAHRRPRRVTAATAAAALTSARAAAGSAARPQDAVHDGTPIAGPMQEVSRLDVEPPARRRA